MTLELPGPKSKRYFKAQNLTPTLPALLSCGAARWKAPPSFAADAEVIDTGHSGDGRSSIWIGSLVPCALATTDASAISNIVQTICDFIASLSYIGMD